MSDGDKLFDDWNEWNKTALFWLIIFIIIMEVVAWLVR
jgi:uncharacterized Rmd1/YagE family protein